ncbi:MAG: hypothetical protein V3V03_08945 [Hyphomonadaceae bacterium]
MNDRLFFPLILILAAAMVFLAMREDPNRLPTGPVGGADTDYGLVVIEDKNLNRILAGGAAEIDLLEQDGVKYLQISAAAGVLADDPALGPHFRLAADLETQYAGFNLKVTISAKPAADQGAMAFEANYSAGKAGQSGWQIFDLVPDWAEYSFEVRVPQNSGQGVDYFGVRPLVPEKTRSVEIRSITFERLGRWDNGENG